jgi:hypothetical protein
LAVSRRKTEGVSSCNMALWACSGAATTTPVWLLLFLSRSRLESFSPYTGFSHQALLIHAQLCFRGTCVGSSESRVMEIGIDRAHPTFLGELSDCCGWFDIEVNVSLTWAAARMLLHTLHSTPWPKHSKSSRKLNELSVTLPSTLDSKRV